MVNKYVSSKFIIEKLYRDYDHQEDLDEADIVEWIGEALDFVGAAPQYELLSKELEIVNHRAPLPCGLISIQAVLYEGQRLPMTSATIGAVDDLQDTDNFLAGREVNTENFPMLHSGSFTSVKSYDVNAGYLMTSFRSGCVTLVYKSVPLDEDNYPMIPDMVSYKEACSTYCQSRLDRRLWRAGKLPEAVYRDSESKWNHYVIQARGKALMPNEDKAEAIRRQWTKLVPNINSWRTLFQDLNLPERRRKQ